MKPLPDIQYLDECFDYDGETGSFTWKERPRHHFATDRGRKITNTSCAGTVAGERCKNGSRVVALGGVHLTVHRICFFLSCGFDGAEAVIPLNGDYADLRAANLGIHGGEKLQSLEARTGAGGRGSTRTYLPLPSLAYLNECFDYCEDTGRLTWKVRPAAHFTARKTWIMWNTRWPGKAAGSNVRGYLKVRLSGTEYQAHRIAYFMHHGTDPAEKLVDHADGNTLNSRPENLRLSSAAGNAQHRVKQQSNNTSGYRGVYRGQNGKWDAQVKTSGKNHYFGTYDTREEAAEVARAKRAELFGEFAGLV